MTGGPFSFGGHPRDAGWEHAETIKVWTEAAFGLDDDAVVMVTELQCREPGCPPLETVIAVLARDGQRRLYKIFKPLAAVTLDDVASLPTSEGGQLHRPPPAG